MIGGIQHAGFAFLSVLAQAKNLVGSSDPLFYITANRLIVEHLIMGDLTAAIAFILGTIWHAVGLLSGRTLYPRWFIFLSPLGVLVLSFAVGGVLPAPFAGYSIALFGTWFMLNTHPLTWVAHPEYLLYTASCALITIFIAHSIVRIMRVFLILDALGLATFAILGTQKVLASGMPPSAAVIAGMLTGVCGGMLRDILCNDIPLVLRKELYAIIALGGSVLYIFLDSLNIPLNINIFICLVAIFATRLWAIFFHIEMPKFDYASSLRKGHRKRRK